jgi:hypothetical protein
MKILLSLLASVTLASAAVDGTVMNATTNKPQPGVIVTLIQPGQQGMQTLGTVKSDAEGKFKFANDLGGNPALLQAIYQSASYNLVLQPNQPATGVEVKVFDSTAKPGVAKVAQHMVLIEPSAQSLEIAETFLMDNETATTFQDPVKGSVQFYLPDTAGGKAEVKITAPGGLPIVRSAVQTAVKNIYKVDYPVKPGESRFDVSYSLPPSDTFRGKILHAEGLTRLVTPGSVTLEGAGIEPLGQEPQTKAHIYNATAAAYTVKVTGTGSLRSQPAQAAAGPDEDNGEPQIEEKPARVYNRMYLIFGFTFAILAVGGVLLYRKTA